MSSTTKKRLSTPDTVRRKSKLGSLPPCCSAKLRKLADVMWTTANSTATTRCAQTERRHLPVSSGKRRENQMIRGTSAARMYHDGIVEPSACGHVTGGDTPAALLPV